MKSSLELKWPELCSQIQSKSIYPPEQGTACPSNSRTKLGVEQGLEPLGCHTSGSLHPLCSRGGQASPDPAKNNAPAAFWGAQCPHLQQPVGFLPLLHPQVQQVWDDLPRAASGARRVFDSFLGKFFPPKGRMQIVGGSRASPGSLLPSGKPLDCEEKHLSCQGRQECKQLLCPAHPAGSELSICHRGTLLFPYKEAHTLSTASQAFPGTLDPKLDT